MPSTQHDVKGKLMWAKVFESNRDRADFHSETDGAYKVTVTTDEATKKDLLKAGFGRKITEVDDGWQFTIDRPHKAKYDWQGGAPVVADVTGKTWNLDEKGFIGNGSEGIVKIEIYQGNNQQRKGARLLGLQVLDHVVYESEGGPSQPSAMFTDHSQGSGSTTSSQQEEPDSIPF